MPKIKEMPKVPKIIEMPKVPKVPKMPKMPERLCLLGSYRDLWSGCGENPVGWALPTKRFCKLGHVQQRTTHRVTIDR
jgi:hypothetical protein